MSWSARSIVLPDAGSDEPLRDLPDRLAWPAAAAVILALSGLSWMALYGLGAWLLG